MPASVVRIENARKHLTNEEKSRREAEQKSITRPAVKLTAPKHIKSDERAYAYWKSTIKRMKEITLLDDLDSEMLAMYCQILSRRDALSTSWRKGNEDALLLDDPALRMAAMARLDDTLKRLEAQERLALQYAEKLGMTPSGRVRLAKKRAEERPVDPDADLYGDGE